jgi:cytochrome c-type biogenesis protein CcmE
MNYRTKRFLIILAIIVGLSFVILAISAAINSSFLLVVSILVLITCVTLFMLVVTDKITFEYTPKELDKRKKERDEVSAKLSEEAKILEAKITSCGEITKKISYYNQLPNYYNRHEDIYVFEFGSKVIVQKEIYDFENFISVSLRNNEKIIPRNDVSTSKTTTSTGNMVGRAIVGGVLLGGVGALAGAATAKKTTTTVTVTQPEEVKNDYEIYIGLSNSKSNILFLKLGTQEDRALEIESVFTSIIEHNKSKAN